MHDINTANKRGLKPKKIKDERDNLVTNRQRNTMIKAKKDYHFEYLLSYKAISRDSKEKQYIRTLKYLIYTYFIYLNPFSFKVYKKRISK